MDVVSEQHIRWHSGFRSGNQASRIGPHDHFPFGVSAVFRWTHKTQATCFTRAFNKFSWLSAIVISPRLMILPSCLSFTNHGYHHVCFICAATASSIKPTFWFGSISSPTYSTEYQDAVIRVFLLGINDIYIMRHILFLPSRSDFEVADTDQYPTCSVLSAWTDSAMFGFF